MGDLHDARRGDHVVAVRPVAGLGGEQHEQRPEPLAARAQQVLGGLGDERGTAGGVVVEGLFHHRHPFAQAGGEGVVLHGEGEGRRRLGAHLMKSPARAARSRSGPGTMPSTRVPAVQSAIVTVVSGDADVTTPGSGPASLKNITRITRT